MGYYRGGDPGFFDFFADTGKKMFEAAVKSTGRAFTASSGQFGLGSLLRGPISTLSNFIPVVGPAIGMASSFAGNMIGGNEGYGGDAGSGFTTMEPPTYGQQDYSQLYTRMEPPTFAPYGYRPMSSGFSGMRMENPLLYGGSQYGSQPLARPPSFGIDYSDISDDWETQEY